MTTMNLKNWIKQIFAKIEFWWAKKRIELNRDFGLSTHLDGVVHKPVIEILRGKFKGVKFQFFNIHLKDQEEGLLEFQTRVVYTPNVNLNIVCREFENLTTNILRIILIDSVRINAKEFDQELENEDRTTNINGTDEERGFYEEISPVLEKRISKRNSRKKAVSRNPRSYSKIQSVTESKHNKVSPSGKD